ncbi:alpha/beta hydrolase [Laribacter hongkongensis]|uniref:alpha/beta fold hydrolase n=1 Tax=Laribacter hongkongensis TaxID=168471 RepID=UPI001EFC6C23|nr:alpha/beta fold hydrolase [Laribacter hongkongensis]MCG9057601.1 alpha/beta hydrolase [Laribacter hongkongensis]MCG9085945.1 alpha/beta hydrolase [Laribacter hongkongensis]
MPMLRLADIGIHYVLDGHPGQPVVVLLNGITMTTRCWEEQVSGLASHFCILRLDFRGQGESDKPDCDYYPLSRQADDVAQVLDQLDIGRVHVVGLSYGGMVAQHFAQRYPDRLDRLVLAATMAYSDAANDAIAASWLAAWQTGDAALRFDLSKPWLYGSRFLAGAAAQVEAIRTANDASTDWAAIARLMLGVARHDSRPWLSAIQAPTLVLVGEEDRLTPLYQARALVRGIRLARMSELAACGHALHAEVPQLFSQHVCNFLTA